MITLMVQHIDDQVNRRRIPNALSIVVFFTAATVFAAGSLLIVMFRASWSFADAAVAARVGYKLPWLFVLAATLAALALCSFRAAARNLAWRRGAAERRTHPAWIVPVVPLAGFFGYVLMRVIRTLHDMGEFDVILYALVDLLPGLAVLTAFGLLALVLPAFACWRRTGVRWAAVGLGVAGALFFVLDPLPPRITAGPWLQVAGEDGMTVCWMTDSPAEAWVEYGPGFAHFAQSCRYGLEEIGPVHRVTLSGLPHGTRVPYRLAVRKLHGISPITARFGATVRSQEFAFSVPDPHAEHTAFAVIADLHEHLDALPELARQLRLDECEFVVFNGDFFEHVNNEFQVVNHLLRPISRLLGGARPFVFVRGNHDARGAYARQLDRFLDLNGHPYVGLFRRGPAAILVMDTGEDKDDGHPQYAGLVDFDGWRREQHELIPELMRDPAWNTASFRVLLAHMAIKQDKLGAAGIDLQLAGHWHTTHHLHPPGREAGFPIVVASGFAGHGPDDFAAARVDVTPRTLEVTVVTRGGTLIARHAWERHTSVITPK